MAELYKIQNYWYTEMDQDVNTLHIIFFLASYVFLNDICFQDI